jgi:hypothetical protein
VARRENAREDLFAEATALVERAELLVPGMPEPIVVGFRNSGAASVYFGQDEAYHFESAGRLRRAYLAGRMYKADRGRLASLDRQRTAAEVQLVRHDLDAAELDQFLDRMQKRLGELKSAVSAGSVQWLREEPGGSGAPEKIVGWLAGLSDRIEVARSARVE